MKFILEFLPIVMFFVTFKWAGNQPEQASHLIGQMLHPFGIELAATTQVPILAATMVAILATFLQILIQKINRKPVENMQWVGLAIIVVFGGATLIFQDETFIKWKPTILYWCMSAGFVVAMLLGKNPLQAMMKGQVDLPAANWRVLLLAWVGFFAIMGVLNLWVAYHFSTDVWVDFKLFGTLGATVVFVFAQGFYLAKHMKPDHTKASDA